MSRKYQSQSHLKNIPGRPEAAKPQPSDLSWFEKKFMPDRVKDHQFKKEAADRDAARYVQELNDYELNMARRAAIEDNNARYRERRRMMSGMPAPIRGMGVAKDIGDAIVDARIARDNTMRSIKNIPPMTAALTAGGLGAAATAGAGALAYGQLIEENLPTDPFSVAGRIASNAYGLIPGSGGGSVGTDPLAQARLSVQDAQRALGSDAVLEAIVLDQLSQEASTGGNTDAFTARVEQLAQQIREEGSINSEGKHVPTPAHQAWDQAYKIAKLEAYGA